MTSKEKLERIENFIWGSPITKEYSEKLNAYVKEIQKDLEILEILKPFLKEVLEINEDGTEVFFKAIRYFNGYIEDINGNWNETEQIKKNKKVKEWLNNE